MKSFRDRNPIAVGLVSLGILTVLVGFAFAVGLLHLLEDTYTVRAEFGDAGGIRGGDDVRVAGIKAGRVTGVKADRQEGKVIVEMEVDSGVDLGRETHAEVALQTLLGTKFVDLSGRVVEPYLAEVPEEDRVIPDERTKTPFDVFELTKVGTRAVQATDTEKLNQFIGQLADISEGRRQTIHQLVEGIAEFSGALNERDSQLRSLLDQADELSALLDEKDATLVGLIDQSQAILDLVSRRRSDIAQGLDAANTAVGQLAGVITSHKTQIDLILETLHPTVDILDRRQADVDRSLAWLGLGAMGLAQAATHGPWNDIYVRDVGPSLIKLLGCTVGTLGPENCT